MPVNRAPIFQAVKALRNDTPWNQSDVDFLDRAIDAATGEQTARFFDAARKPTPAPVPVPQPPIPSPGFQLSTTSKNKLMVVKPELRHCVELAITLSPVDFTVAQTQRSVEQQKVAVASGNSRTMHSKHLKQADGWIWAVDLAPVVAGKVEWTLNQHYGQLAYAMDRAATELGIAGHVRWGCAWDRVLSDFGGDPSAYLAEAQAYAKRHPGSDLLDGPHFEWVS